MIEEPGSQPSISTYGDTSLSGTAFALSSSSSTTSFKFQHYLISLNPQASLLPPHTKTIKPKKCYHTILLRSFPSFLISDFCAFHPLWHPFDSFECYFCHCFVVVSFSGLLKFVLESAWTHFSDFLIRTWLAYIAFFMLLDPNWTCFCTQFCWFKPRKDVKTTKKVVTRLEKAESPFSSVKEGSINFYFHFSFLLLETVQRNEKLIK